MAIIYANTGDGYVAKIRQSTWAGARDATSGVGNSSSTSSSNAITAMYALMKYGVYRSFLSFDTSGISSAVQSATLKIKGLSNGDGDIIAVKATSDISPLGGADFNAIEGWQASGDNESNVTKYSNTISSWNTSGYNSITLNSQALTDMKDTGTIYICLLNYSHDLNDSAPSSSTSKKNGMYYSDSLGTSKDPYIDYTLAPTDNAVFMGMNF